jgi:chlorophyllide a reductase subunit Y
MPEELLPRKIGDAEVVLVRGCTYAIHSHPEAKDIAAAALLNRLAEREGHVNSKSVVLLGERFRRSADD